MLYFFRCYPEPETPWNGWPLSVSQHFLRIRIGGMEPTDVRLHVHTVPGTVLRGVHHHVLSNHCQRRLSWVGGAVSIEPWVVSVMRLVQRYGGSDDDGFFYIYFLYLFARYFLFYFILASTIVELYQVFRQVGLWCYLNCSWDGQTRPWVRVSQWHEPMGDLSPRMWRFIQSQPSRSTSTAQYLLES